MDTPTPHIVLRDGVYRSLNGAALCTRCARQARCERYGDITECIVWSTWLPGVPKRGE